MKNHEIFTIDLTQDLSDHFNVSIETINEFDLNPVFIEYANHIAQGEDAVTAYDFVKKLAIESLKENF